MPTSNLGFDQITTECVEDFISSFDTILLDCDGVLWKGEDAIKGAAATVQKLRELGKQPVFLTNYSILSRKQLLEKFNHLGFDVNEEEIYSSAALAGLYLKSHLNPKHQVYILGSNGLRDEIESHGVRVAPTDSENHVNDIPELTDTLKIDPTIKAVVCAFDINFNYRKLLRATNILTNKNNMFLVTNPDPRLITGDGWIVPDCGCIVEALKKGTHREPLMLGKPNTLAWRFIQERFHVNPERTVMIGDSLNTDIVFGFNCGIRRALVLSGISKYDEVVSRLEELKDHPEAEKWIPNYYMKSLGALGEMISKAGVCPPTYKERNLSTDSLASSNGLDFSSMVTLDDIQEPAC